jgi:hypothetical protein
MIGHGGNLRDLAALMTKHYQTVNDYAEMEN